MRRTYVPTWYISADGRNAFPRPPVRSPYSTRVPKRRAERQKWSPVLPAVSRIEECSIVPFQVQVTHSFDSGDFRNGETARRKGLEHTRKAVSITLQSVSYVRGMQSSSRVRKGTKLLRRNKTCWYLFYSNNPNLGVSGNFAHSQLPKMLKASPVSTQSLEHGKPASHPRPLPDPPSRFIASSGRPRCLRGPRSVSADTWPAQRDQQKNSRKRPRLLSFYRSIS